MWTEDDLGDLKKKKKLSITLFQDILDLFIFLIVKKETTSSELVRLNLNRD